MSRWLRRNSKFSMKGVERLRDQGEGGSKAPGATSSKELCLKSLRKTGKTPDSSRIRKWASGTGLRSVSEKGLMGGVCSEKNGDSNCSQCPTVPGGGGERDRVGKSGVVVN